MNLKKILRWAVRRDADASSLFGGWVMQLSVLVSTVYGVRNGVIDGILIFGGFWVLRAIAGYFDFNVVHGSKYRNDYISKKAPNNVKVIKK